VVVVVEVLDSRRSPGAVHWGHRLLGLGAVTGAVLAALVLPQRAAPPPPAVTCGPNCAVPSTVLSDAAFVSMVHRHCPGLRRLQLGDVRVALGTKVGRGPVVRMQLDAGGPAVELLVVRCPSERRTTPAHRVRPARSVVTHPAHRG
jgi:hypothetical protein